MWHSVPGNYHTIVNTHCWHTIVIIIIIIMTMILYDTLFKFYVIAHNALGKGDPSNAIAVRTLGSGIVL